MILALVALLAPSLAVALADTLFTGNASNWGCWTHFCGSWGDPDLAKMTCCACPFIFFLAPDIQYRQSPFYKLCLLPGMIRCSASQVSTLFFCSMSFWTPDDKRLYVVPVGAGDLQTSVTCNMVAKRLRETGQLIEQRLQHGAWG